ncbi:beta-mannosidase [Ferruginibacter sp. HRS2-29]|nr:beta-mannosidase [Ferruginibacter sp. HRS2-29]
MARKFFLILFLPTVVFSAQAQQSSFVKAHDGKFTIEGKPYRFIGANYWFAGILGTTEAGKARIVKELDFLIAHGVDNLRVMAVAEGSGLISGVERVQPAFQQEKGKYDTTLLKALDFLLAEMSRRHMKAVLYLSNNWEWSGGFLQYLNWNGLLPDSVMRRKLTWDEQRDYTSKFYGCKPCIEQQKKVLQMIVQRTNSITGQKYADDPSIMSWELANEPRPMRPGAYREYQHWIFSTSELIKTLDKNHLVTTGMEGDIGTEGMANFIALHDSKYIDYATIHIWPKNWGWFSDTSITKSRDTIYKNSRNFIDRHEAVMRKIKKPMVIEEFGLPRDQHSFLLTSTTNSRDQYYAFIFDQLLENIKKGGVIQGANFWALGGAGRPSYKQPLWQKGEDLLGDPPMEEQGLNAVFDTDESTWKLIADYIKKIK